MKICYQQPHLLLSGITASLMLGVGIEGCQLFQFVSDIVAVFSDASSSAVVAICLQILFTRLENCMWMEMTVILRENCGNGDNISLKSVSYTHLTLPTKRIV